MVAASQKHEQASDFRFGTDNYLPFQEEGSRQQEEFGLERGYDADDAQEHDR